MKSLAQYTVQFNGLDNKDYNYNFIVSDEFFTYFENSEIKGANLDVRLILTKHSDSLELDIELKGKVKIICDRCLDEYFEIINFRDIIEVKFGDETNFDTNEDYITIKKGENSINISQFIYEFAHFGLPLTHFHPQDNNGNSTCNPEMLKILERYSLSEEKKEQIDETNVDTWLSQLSDINNKMLNN